MHETTRQFVDAAREAYGFDPETEAFPEGTKTAADAADAIGCDVAQIVKSLVFELSDDDAERTAQDDAEQPTARSDAAQTAQDDAEQPTAPAVVVVLTAGHHRVDSEALAEALGVADASPADPETVKRATGWSIGGVPPICHERDLPVYLDESLLDHPQVFAAAGTPEAVFGIEPDELRALADPEPIAAFESSGE
jgi:prolyl-tRNA editing enzyme YbaK/EbsC (Cys-tRNA(Pro) deacylase)